MSFLHAKVLTCPACKATVFCSPDQTGHDVVCPQCGARFPLPAEPSSAPSPLPAQDGNTAPKPPPLPQQPPKLPGLREEKPLQRRRKGKGCLLFGCLGCGGVLLLTVGLGVFMAFTSLMPGRLDHLCEICETTPLAKPLISHGVVPAVAPAPVALGNSDIDIAVTRVERACPTIYQEALHTASATQTPLYCVTVEITNRGDTPAHYRSWRELADEADLKRAATLRDGTGRLHGSISFGPRTWPAGTQPEQDIEPNDTCRDLLLFECAGEEPDDGEFLLTLPGENLGHKATLRFRIPQGQIRNDVAAPSR